jgi:hypothetical protein
MPVTSLFNNCIQTYLYVAGILGQIPGGINTSPGLKGLITFPHRILLNLLEAHVDYAEQFLVDKNTQLPCLFDLYIKYESLEMVTNNFINDATRLTCTQLKRFYMDILFV